MAISSYTFYHVQNQKSNVILATLPEESNEHENSTKSISMRLKTRDYYSLDPIKTTNKYFKTQHSATSCFEFNLVLLNLLIIINSETHRICIEKRLSPIVLSINIFLMKPNTLLRLIPIQFGLV